MKNTGKVPNATICTGHMQAGIEEEGKVENICILQLLADCITEDMIFLTCEMRYSLNGKISFPMYAFELHICISLL